MSRLTPVPLADLAGKINAEHHACEAAIRAGCQHALEAGKLLLDAKGQIGHGGWLPWLQANFEGSERTAQAYMRVAQRWPAIEAANPQRAADLSLRQALAELAEPKPLMTLAEAEEWLSRGRDLVKEAADMIMALASRAEPGDAAAMLESLQSELDGSLPDDVLHLIYDPIFDEARARLASRPPAAAK